MKNTTKRNHKRKTKICFDEELVTKDSAKDLCFKEKERQDSCIKSALKVIKKRKTPKVFSEDDRVIKEPVKSTSTEKKIVDHVETDSNITDQGEGSHEVNKDSKKESIRSLKRKKHAILMEGKKVKLELELQQKALNYLSKWKHNQTEWKFEKLRQVWLTQNLFDSNKIPNTFWDTTLEYFSGAKGHSRQFVLEQAIKYIEDGEQISCEMTDESQIKLQRAKDIVQYLQ